MLCGQVASGPIEFSRIFPDIDGERDGSLRIEEASSHFKLSRGHRSGSGMIATFSMFNGGKYASR